MPCVVFDQDLPSVLALFLLALRDDVGGFLTLTKVALVYGSAADRITMSEAIKCEE